MTKNICTHFSDYSKSHAREFLKVYLKIKLHLYLTNKNSIYPSRHEEISSQLFHYESIWNIYFCLNLRQRKSRENVLAGSCLCILDTYI